MPYRRRCWTCKYAPGGHPWYGGAPSAHPEKLMWCGVGKQLVGRSHGEHCPEWVLVDRPRNCVRES